MIVHHLIRWFLDPRLGLRHPAGPIGPSVSVLNYHFCWMITGSRAATWDCDALERKGVNVFDWRFHASTLLRLYASTPSLPASHKTRCPVSERGGGPRWACPGGGRAAVRRNILAGRGPKSLEPFYYRYLDVGRRNGTNRTGGRGARDGLSQGMFCVLRCLELTQDCLYRPGKSGYTESQAGDYPASGWGAARAPPPTRTESAQIDACLPRRNALTISAANHFAPNSTK